VLDMLDAQKIPQIAYIPDLDMAI